MNRLIVFVLLVVQYQATADYIAAVVEYNPIFSGNPNVTKLEAQSIMMSNLAQYQDYIDTAARQGAQIIVFPEYGLYGADFDSREQIFPYLEVIPNVNASSVPIIPCEDPSFSDRPVQRGVSCIAQTYNIVVVLDMGDVQYCNNTDPNCPEDGRYQYNTQVAFGSNGQILAKYHKSHLYYEPQFNEPDVPEVVVFETTFGVKFGMMICFDLMFAHPQTDLYALGINNIVFSSWWVNYPPSLTATQVQLANSRVSKLNLLAANSGANWFSSGSGIYSNGKLLQTFYNPNWQPEDKMLIATVPEMSEEPVVGNQSDVDLEELFSMLESIAPNSRVVNTKPGSTGSATVSYEDVECTVSYSISPNSPVTNDIYAIVAYAGPNGLLTRFELCGLMICPEAQNCTNYVIASNTTFSSFKVSASFKTPNLHVLAMVAATNDQLVDPSLYTVQDDELGVSSNLNFEGTMISATVIGIGW